MWLVLETVKVATQNMKRKSKFYILSYDLRAKRSKAGIGLFSRSPIKKGACVIEYVGRLVKGEEEYTSKSKYLFEVTKKKTIDGRPRWNKAGYINHSCKPNCEITTYCGRVYVMAKRRIKEGEELTYDYGKEYWNEHIKPLGCRCSKCKL